MGNFVSHLPSSVPISFPLFLQSRCELGKQQSKCFGGTSPTPPKLPQGELVGHWRQDSLTNEWLRVCSKTTRVWIPVSLFIRCMILGNYFTSLCLCFFTDNVGVLIVLSPQDYEINEMIYTNVNPMMLLHITACRLGFRTSVLAAGSPAPAEGCVSGCALLSLASDRTECGRRAIGTSLCSQFPWEWGHVPSILLVGKHKQTSNCFRNP